MEILLTGKNKIIQKRRYSLAVLKRPNISAKGDHLIAISLFDYIRHNLIGYDEFGHALGSGGYLVFM